MVLTGENLVLRKIPSVPTENLIRADLELNQDIHSEVLASNCLRNGAFQTARLASLNYTRVHTRCSHVVLS